MSLDRVVPQGEARHLHPGHLHDMSVMLAQNVERRVPSNIILLLYLSESAFTPSAA